MNERDSNLLRVFKLLANQTRTGKLQWEESYAGHQATLGNQTVVIRAATRNIEGGLMNPVSFEIRGPSGEIVEEIDGAIVVDYQTRHSYDVIEAMTRLYNLVLNQKQIVADAAVLQLLKSLEKDTG